MGKQEFTDRHKKVYLDGKVFAWTGSKWYDPRTFLIPPKVVINRLNALLTKELEPEDLATTNIHVLLHKAKNARDAEQLARAEKLVRRVLKLSPGNVVALAILCSTLRARNRPQQALQETQGYWEIDYAPLVTSRAAAYCDLKQWEKAKSEIGRALAIEKSDEAFNVVERIKANRPDLYEKSDLTN